MFWSTIKTERLIVTPDIFVNIPNDCNFHICMSVVHSYRDPIPWEIFRWNIFCSSSKFSLSFHFESPWCILSNKEKGIQSMCSERVNLCAMKAESVMLTRPQPHEAQATTHEAEATTHEANAKTHLEILIIIPLPSTSFCLQILHFAVHLLADLSIVNSLEANLIILGWVTHSSNDAIFIKEIEPQCQYYRGLHCPLGMT